MALAYIRAPFQNPAIMAMIERIRNRQGLLMGVIGLGMLGFLVPFDAVMAMLGNSAGPSNAGVIDGQEISLQDYRIMVQNRQVLFNYQDNKAAGNEVWGELIQTTMLEDELDAVGLSVCAEEFDDIRYGDYLSAFVKQSFYGNTITEDAKQNWQATFSQMFSGDPVKYDGYANAIVIKRKFEKFESLVTSGIQSNSLEAKAEYNAGFAKVDFEYVLKRYSSIGEDEVSVSDGDVEDYYDAHSDEAKYAQRAGRDIEYLRIPISASAEDRAAAQTALQSISASWAATDDDATFMEDAGYAGAYTQTDLKPSQFKNESNAKDLENAKTGQVVGPYFEGDFIRLDRVIARETVADSTVKCRHILLKATDVKDADQMAALHARADSLKRRLRAGDSFSDLVNKHTEDPGSKATGGEYEFQRGRMVKSFEDFCFDNRVGAIGTAETNYGLHLIEVLDQQWTAENVTLGRVSQSLEVSGKAAKAAYDIASEFSFVNESSDAFRTAADEMGWAVVESRGIARTATAISGLQNAGEVIGWSFGAETDEVSNPFRVGDDYIVATLVRVKEAGTPPLEFVLDQMKAGALIEAKAAVYMAQMEGATLEEVAEAIGETVKVAAGISLKTPSIPAAGGAEPVIIGRASGLAVGDMSGPIQGLNGVWVIRGKAATQAPEKTDFTSETNVLNSKMRASSARNLLGAVVIAGDVQDTRSGN